MKLTQADLSRIEDISYDIMELVDTYEQIDNDHQHYSCADYINLKSDMEEIDDEVRKMKVSQAYQHYKFMKSHERNTQIYRKCYVC